VLTLTVDHGLNPDSADWSERAQAAARALGADWRGLVWRGDKPASGLPAAARLARHRLLADAARKAGARVILLAHTADDVAEGELMRAEGSTLGRLRDWSPSPVWPEGRGLMLLRPLLDARRADLRDYLRERDADWIEDPANEDPRFARARARRSLTAMTPLLDPPQEGPVTGVLGVEDDIIRLSRQVTARALSAALVCAGGGERPPRGDRLAAVLKRLRSGQAFTATLCGARMEANGEHVFVTREPGEFRRLSVQPLPLRRGVETIWDGRWSLAAPDDGWSVVPAAGRLATLSDADRALLGPLPPAARGARPVLIRNAPDASVLAGEGVKAKALVEARLALALDGMTHEQDLDALARGVLPRNHLFSGVTSSNDGAPTRLEETRRE
jgi:tRNA(Ile)-lysidine synthase